MSSETIEKDSKKKLLASEEAAEKNRAAARDEDDSDDEEDEDDEEESNGSSGSSGGSSGRSKASFDATPAEKVIVNRPSSAKMVWTLAQARDRRLPELGDHVHRHLGEPRRSSGSGSSSTRAASGRSTAPRCSACSTPCRAALCFLTIPLFTMRTLSDEKRVGTIELLITMPVKDSEVILGKFFGALAMVTLQIALLAASTRSSCSPARRSGTSVSSTGARSGWECWASSCCLQRAPPSASCGRRSPRARSSRSSRPCSR